MTALTVEGDLLHYDDIAGPDGAPVVVWGHGFLLSGAFYSAIIDSSRSVFPTLSTTESQAMRPS